MAAAAEKVPWKQRKDVAFWRGGFTNEQRRVLANSAIIKASGKADIQLISWEDDQQGDAFNNKFVSLAEHCQYRYVLLLRATSVPPPPIPHPPLSAKLSLSCLPVLPRPLRPPCIWRTIHHAPGRSPLLTNSSVQNCSPLGQVKGQVIPPFTVLLCLPRCLAHGFAGSAPLAPPPPPASFPAPDEFLPAWVECGLCRSQSNSQNPPPLNILPPTIITGFSSEELVSNRYLLHLAGYTYSGRLKYLLACASPVIFASQEDMHVEFWHHMLRNGTNIVFMSELVFCPKEPANNIGGGTGKCQRGTQVFTFNEDNSQRKGRYQRYLRVLAPAGAGR